MTTETPYAYTGSMDWYNGPRQKQLDRLESLKGTTELVPFCTRIMSDRGTVYYCRIDADGNAIVERAETWWAMSFADATEEHKGKVLGKVEVKQISGAIAFHLGVGYLQEGRG